MKKQLATTVAAALLATTGFSMSAQAEDEGGIGISASVGLVSDYYYRGVNLGGAGAHAGLEYGIAGFYVGAWAIDDGGAGTGEDGFETDFYLGYGMEHGIFSWDISYTRYEYTYTGDFEQEIAINLGLAGVSLGLVAGEDKDTGVKDPTDYNVFTLGYGYDIYSVTVGHFVADGGAAKDPSYNWAEFSVAGEVGGLVDVGLTIGSTFGVKEDALGFGPTKSGDGYIFLDISKSFSF